MCIPEMTYASAPLLWYIQCKQTVVQQPKVTPFTTFGFMNQCIVVEGSIFEICMAIQVRTVLLGEIVVEYDSLTCDWTHFIQKSQTTRLTDQ